METAGALFTGRGRDPSSEPTEEPVSWATTLLSARNYGPTVLVQQEAKKRGCEQVLWLYGPDHQLTEVGTMNIFIYWTHEDGGEPSRDTPPPRPGKSGSFVSPSRLQVSRIGAGLGWPLRRWAGAPAGGR